MKTNRNFLYLLFVLLISSVYACKESFVYEDSITLSANEFTFVPESPFAEQEIEMLYYGCNYYVTSSTTIEKKNILVTKKFNGTMKRPCILEYDTMSLGKLQKGRYLVTLEIIDINPFTDDSLFYSRSKTLSVY
jgi:hypothetical protein